MYRPGGCSPNDRNNFDILIYCLNKFCTSDVTSHVLSDLNCPNIDWVESCVKNDTMQKHFFDSMCTLGMTQYVCEATRGDNILDIVMCNDPFLIFDVKV